MRVKQQIKISQMTSEKKIKLPSLLSFSSLPSLPGGKKNLLKPLQLSDVIVAMVQEQLSTDKTKQLKSYLTKNRRKTVYIDQQEQLIRSPLQDLPDFAKKEWGFVQLLKYHIEKKRPNPQQDIALYQKKLQEIEEAFTNSLQKYKQELQEGKNAIEDIEVNVNSLYETTLISQKQIRETNAKIQKYGKRILQNIRKQQNLSKTIAIAKAWSKSNISKVLSQSLLSIQRLNINQVMHQITKCSQQIKQQGCNNELQNSDKVLKVIQQRRLKIIQRVQKNMLFAIINFNDQQTYQRAYQQYNDLLKNLSQSNQEKFIQYHLLQKQNIQQMIQDNIDHIYWRSLQLVSTINNIQLLREETYINFITKLVQTYNDYIVKWHKVTSYHVNSNTQQKDSFLKMLPHVADKIVKKIFHLLKYSQKFFSFSFQNKLRTIIEVNKLVEFVEEWTGKKDISLFQILREKFRTEIENFRKQTNGSLKLCFVEEFSEESLMAKLKRKSSTGVDEDKVDRSNNLDNGKVLDGGLESGEKVRQREKIKEILKTKLFSQAIDPSSSPTSSPRKNSIPRKEQQHSKSLISSLNELKAQPFDLNLSRVLVKIISQYCQRQEILPFGHLDCILEHIDFLILLIFKVCVYEDTKHTLFEDFSQKAFAKLKEVETGIQKNVYDQVLITNLGKMRDSFINRKNYLELHNYLCEFIDTKFDNVVVSGFVNINKLYQNPQQNHQMLTNYHIKLVKLIEELLKISRWLISNQHNFSQYEQLGRKLQYLPTVLIQLGFLYFEQYNLGLCQKYMQTIEPLMRNLKWKIQKFNQQVTLQFRQYKINILQIYRSSTLNIGIKDKQLYQQLTNKQLQIFYKALLYLYCKIDKINDNGRQVLRLDAIEISKILKQVGYDPGSWAVWFQKFVQTIMERSMKTIVERIEQLGIVYPVYCWRSQLLGIVGNLSTKEKKEYMTHLLKIYVEQLKHLPQL